MYLIDWIFAGVCIKLAKVASPNLPRRGGICPKSDFEKKNKILSPPDRTGRE
jgi:hypothetical protein